MKTSEQMAEEYGASPQEKDAFLAGYQAATNSSKTAGGEMNEQDKQFLACLCVWLDWNIYQSIKSLDSCGWNTKHKSLEDMQLEAKELVEKFSFPAKDK